MKANGLAACLLALPLLTGCGVGEYEKRMEATQVDYQRVEKFAPLYGAESVAGGNVTVRIPQFFKEPKLVEAPGAVQPNVQPAFPAASGYKIPGLVYTYEQHVKDDQNVSWACYCYLAVVETRPTVQGQPGLPEYLAAQLALAFPDQKPAWTGPEKCETPDGPIGQTIDWYKLTAAGDMLFDKDSNGKHEYPKTKGTYELWMYQAPGSYTVLLGWRYPDAVVTKTPFVELRKRSAGTVKIKEPQPLPPDPTATLGNEATVGPYKLKIPAGYQPKPAPISKPGATILSWAAPGDAAVMVAAALPADPTYLSNEQILKATIREINAALQLTPEPAQHGLINGLRAVQAKVASAGQPPLSGVVFVASDGATPIVIIGFAAAGDPSGQLKQISAAALSLNRAK